MESEGEMAKRKARSEPKGLQFKSFEFDTKAVADEPDDDGFVYIEAYASVFDNVDSHNDIIVKGAYADTLKAWAEKGAPIPSYYNHGAFSNDPHDNVGFLAEAKEDDYGLKVRMALDVAHNAKAAYAHRLIKQDRMRELSVGYIAKSWELVHEDGKREWEYTRKLTALDLLEVSVVSVASNPLATVTAKAAQLLYGEAEEDESIDEDEADEKATIDDEQLTVLLDELTTAKTAFDAAFTTLSDAVSAVLDTDDDSDDPDADDNNDPGQEAGEKSGKLSAQARRAIALMALHGADKENAR